jgi:hypothetical protein
MFFEIFQRIIHIKYKYGSISKILNVFILKLDLQHFVEKNFFKIQDGHQIFKKINYHLKIEFALFFGKKIVPKTSRFA